MHEFSRRQRLHRATMTQRWMVVCLGTTILLESVRAGTGRATFPSRTPSFVPRQEYDRPYNKDPDGALFMTIPATWVVSSRSPTEELMIDDDGIQTHAPRIHVQDMVLALSWTSKLNDQLQEWGTLSEFKSDPLDMLRGGGGGILASQIRRPYRIPLSQPKPETPHHSIWRIERRISNLDLSQFLRQVLNLLMKDHGRRTDEGDSMVRTLALLYLDRACSMTLSTKKLPFLSTETVHTLSLTALLVAWAALYGELSDHAAASDPLLMQIYQHLEATMGISAVDSQRRVACMLAALHGDGTDDGDVGLWVTPLALQEWNERWLSRFASRV